MKPTKKVEPKKVTKEKKATLKDVRAAQHLAIVAIKKMHNAMRAYKETCKTTTEYYKAGAYIFNLQVVSGEPLIADTGERVVGSGSAAGEENIMDICMADIKRQTEKASAPNPFALFK